MLGDCAFSRCFADDPGGQALALQGEAAARTLQGSLLSGQKQGRMNGLFAHRCEETAQAVASYWNASLEDVTRIVNGCIQVGLFNGELYEKHRILTSADIQRNYMDHVRSCGLLSRYPDIPKEFELSAS